MLTATETHSAGATIQEIQDAFFLNWNWRDNSGTYSRFSWAFAWIACCGGGCAASSLSTGPLLNRLACTCTLNPRRGYMTDCSLLVGWLLPFLCGPCIKLVGGEDENKVEDHLGRTRS